MSERRPGLRSLPSRKVKRERSDVVAADFPNVELSAGVPEAPMAAEAPANVVPSRKVKRERSDVVAADIPNVELSVGVPEAPMAAEAPANVVPSRKVKRERSDVVAADFPNVELSVGVPEAPMAAEAPANVEQPIVAAEAPANERPIVAPEAPVDDERRPEAPANGMAVIMEAEDLRQLRIVHPQRIWTWTVQDVHFFISGIPGCAAYAQRFVVHEIDGQALLLIHLSDMIDHLGIKVGPALKIMNHIDNMRPDM